MPESDLTDPLVWNELDGSANRPDRARAGPTEDGLVVMWSIYWPLLLLFSLVIMILFLALLTNKKVRKNPFNKYVIFLSFPDFLYSFLCFLTCLLSALKRSYSSWEMCQFQVFYLQFGAAANAWLNGAMAHEVYKLLRSSQIRKKYYPPTDRQVYATAAVCYSIAVVAGALPLVGNIVDFLPEPGIQSGFLCATAEETLTDSLVWWFILAPICFGVPYVYAVYVFCDVVFYSKLLPPRGRRRELAVYFFRIGAMFLFFWMPTISIMYIFRGMASPWLSWGLGLFSHTQGLVSAMVAMLKKDVREAVFSFSLGPCGYKTPETTKGRRGSQTGATGVNSSSEAPSERLVVADELGLPMQGKDFQFLDENSGPIKGKRTYRTASSDDSFPLRGDATVDGRDPLSEDDNEEDVAELGERLHKWASPRK